MKKRNEHHTKYMKVLQTLFVSYAITGILLIILAMFLYKLKLGEKEVAAAIVGIYVISTGIGGVIIGKRMKKKRLFWGLGLGIGYFVLLFAITLGIYHSFQGNNTQILTTLLLCASGGMLGAMIS